MTIILKLKPLETSEALQDTPCQDIVSLGVDTDTLMLIPLVA